MKISKNSYKKIQGLSLIEMMVSMVIGLFLIGGLTTMYLGSKQSDKLRSAVSDIEESARLTLNTLRESVEHAGYRSVDNPVLPLDKPFQTVSDGLIQNEFCRDGSTAITNASLLTPPTELSSYTKDGSVADSESDMLTVAYRADNPNNGSVIFDCARGDYLASVTTVAEAREKQISCSTDPDNGINERAKIYNALYIDPADKTLRCLGSRSPTGSQVLAENIENMQVRYGVMKIKTDESRETVYKNATQIENNNEWFAVTSIQIAILVSSEKEVLDVAESHSFELLDETISLDADRKLYRTFSTTIHLPNRSRRELQSVTRRSAEAT